MINLNISKQVKQRLYKPYLHQTFYDTLNEQYLIITNPFLLTRTAKSIVAFRYLNGGPEYIVTLDVFNHVTDNEFDFIEANNPQVIYKEVNRLDKAIELLKRVYDEDVKNIELYNEITSFLEII